MFSLTISQIANAIGCSSNSQEEILEVVTDSRKAKKGTLFVAIKGENFDGNDFVAVALEMGVSMVITQNLQTIEDARVFVVADTKMALIAIGGYYRDKFPIPYIGVTGSIGKTTTKEFIHCVLSSGYNTLKNEGNQNNELGVPNTLFRLTKNHTAAVIEMGMNQLGDISALTNAVKPAIAVITCIGVSHLELLGSRENILKAKLEIFEGMKDNSTVFLSGDDEYLNTVSSKKLKIYRYSVENSNSELQAVNIITKNGETSFDIISPWGEVKATIPTFGVHNVKNALVAFGVGCAMGITPKKSAKALLDYIPAEMRQKMVQHKGYTIVEDCYNSAPDSLNAASNALATYTTNGRRILVLSDMLELGSNEVALHSGCGEVISELPIDCLYTMGTLAEHISLSAEKIKNKKHISTKDELFDFLCSEIKKDDVVWFKASRGVKLEEVIHRMYQGGTK